MSNLFEDRIDIKEDIVKEYFRRNEEKKGHEKWIKKHRGSVLKAMKGKKAADVGEYRIKVTVPDNSCFDNTKVLSFLESRNVLEETTDRIPNENKIELAISQGLFTIKQLQEAAWVTQAGSPRVSITKRKN